MSRSSGDLLADRRFAYAEALLAEGDATAAADLLTQTLAMVPGWIPAWIALGTACERQGDRAAAAEAYRRGAALDDSGVFGAALHRARLDEGGSLPVMPERFVAALFDDYAPRFDDHLLADLGYRGPALLMAAIERSTDASFEIGIDLGCGTGLMGAALRERVDDLTGVDLSAAMIAAARRRNLYDRLAVAEIHRFIDDGPAGACDLVVAADVFAYIGPIDATLRTVARALRGGGFVAFTVQRFDGVGVCFGADMRFSHAPTFVAEAVAAAGLDLLSIEDASTRRDAGADVPGLVVVARKA